MPLSPIYGNRALSNRFRHYERLASPLGGFVSIGDGACVFNPVYGQGMTTAVLSAEVLASEVRAARAGFGPEFSRRLFRTQARTFRSIWGLATGADVTEMH
jgi:2-polyprenyl-6-methoxyphenol hydroxylase-like FAD-dependent oxidoreductase